MKVIKRSVLSTLIYLMIFLVLAVIGHSFYIYRFLKDGTIFTGPNDGLEQMLPMQLYLYHKITSGKFFYDMDFGLGGDFYTDLAYYYSTSVVFFVNVIGVRLLDVFLSLKTNTIQFWAVNAFYISIVKSAAAMYFTYLYLRWLKVKELPAVLGAFLFLTAAIYFRFTLYWSFFSDVFIFLPLLLLGIERYIQGGRKGMFITAASLIFINNFYFAYYQVLFGLIYFLIRNIFRHPDDKLSRLKQWTGFIIMSALGIGIALFSFFYGVKGFMQNDRAPFKDPIPLFSPFDQHANIFYDNYLVIVLYITLQALLTFKFYKSYYYRLFALMTLALIYLSFMPFIDSVFNGFSAPQKRWHYLLTFFSSGLIAMYISRFKTISIQNYLYSIIPGAVIVGLSYVYIAKKVDWIWFLPLTAVLGLLVLMMKQQSLKQTAYIALVLSIAALDLVVVKDHNLYDNYNPGINGRAKMSYIDSSVYNSGLQQQIIDELKSTLKPGERIDWRVLEQDNTPMYQSFSGVSLYSSIFDGSIIDYFYNKLKINIKEESISRYSGLQERSNLESLFNVRYVVRKDYQHDVPENFKLIRTVGRYRIYENTKMLPVVRITSNITQQDTLTEPIDREHAMIEGVVLQHAKTNFQLPRSDNLLAESHVTPSGAQWLKDDILKVEPPSGGVIVTLPQHALNNKEFYIDMTVTLTSAESNIQINVNGYANNRLFKTSKYRTHQDHLLYRVKPKDGKILVGLTHGTYRFKINGIYGENYKTLTQAAGHTDHIFKEVGNKMSVTLHDPQSGYLITPIVYRDGLTAEVDGRAVPVKRANYLMSAVKVTSGSHIVTFKYIPPYFYLMVTVSILSAGLSVLYIYGRRRNERHDETT
ncbi:YfhO family protein [Macrococcus equipercicus]|nr:YfhO family protein [Macrococcus equipercicus]